MIIKAIIIIIIIVIEIEGIITPLKEKNNKDKYRNKKFKKNFSLNKT